jgi:arsenite methyltransferase
MDIHESVQDYYGKELSTSSDLKTNACCTAFSYPDSVKKAMGTIHDEVMSKYYGCGLTLPKQLKDMKILDLGSGSGRDCYIAAQLVGENGEVVGVDMTDEQLEVANRHIEFHREQFGFKKSNVRFVKGFLEHLDDAGIEDNYYDIIISNCVINLVKDKQKVLTSVFNKLKEGGEFYFSDVYTNKRMAQELIDDPVLYGECLSGALYVNDFISMARKAGFNVVRSVEAAPITVQNKKLEKQLEGYQFESITYRLFKIPNFEDKCEDYGQAVMYLGGIKDSENSFLLDDEHTFLKGKVEPVCGNTYSMLHETRFKDFFEFYGTWDNHFGEYGACGTSVVMTGTKGRGESQGSCC